jgi:outer membrane protein OmpA-like peptidoglycan-associated protein
MVHQGIEEAGISPGPATRGWVPRVAAAVLVLGLTACSSLPDVPDYANPAEWYRSSTDMVGNWFTDDTPKIESTSPTSASTKSPKKAEEKFPNLGSVPDKPATKSTTSERAKLTNQLSTDRANARYTDSKTPSAAKPAMVGAASKPAPAARKSPPPAPKSATSQQLARLPSSVYSGKRSSLWPNAPAPSASSGIATTSARVGRPVVSSSGTIRNPPAAAAPRVVPTTPKPTAMSTTAMSTTATTMAAPVAPPAPEIPPRFKLSPPSDAQIAAAPAPRDTATPMLQLTPPSGYSSAGGFNGQQPMLSLGPIDQSGAAGIVSFRHGSARLSASDRSRLGRLAREAMDVGAYLRVVGHASMRTRDMDPFEHTLANFNISLKRANVVASALIEMGVPAERLIVDAVGDTQPLFSEAMPSGERGNRRAEVYLES